MNDSSAERSGVGNDVAKLDIEQRKMEIEQRRINIEQMKASVVQSCNNAICMKVEQARRNAEVLMKMGAEWVIDASNQLAERSAQKKDVKDVATACDGIGKQILDLLKQSFENMGDVSKIKSEIK